MSAMTLMWLVHPSHQRCMADWSELLPGFDVTQVASVGAAMNVLTSSRMDCVLVTGGVDGISAAEVLEALQSSDSSLPLVFSDQEITAGDAIQLVRRGAHHCFCPKDDWSQVASALESAAEEKRRAARFRDAATSRFSQWLIGSGRAMEYVYDTIALVGPRKCTVLISGETGTGKEMAARALHAVSPRSQRPMVSVNCGAIPENLLEAELFGHVKGAFTGALGLRIGRFEQANHGTIFLDEIGELPLGLQAKLLRALQEREIQRLGSSETIKLDVRVIAATNQRLLERVRSGEFREDLYYRLNVVPLRMPPLRERPDDIPQLVDHFAAKVCRAEGIPVKTVSPETKQRLSEQPWPGNVRQLENLVEATIALSGDRETLSAADFGILPFDAAPKVIEMAMSSVPLSEGLTFEKQVNRFERSLLEHALERARGNRTVAAGMLGMKRTTLVMKLRGLQKSYDERDLEVVG